MRLSTPIRTLAALGLWLAPALGLADEAPKPDSGDTAWLLTSTALVLLMTLPGLALFYGGLVRSKNVLSVLMQCFSIACLVTVIWVLYGYSLAFSTAGMEKGTLNLASFIGGFDKVLFAGMARDALTGTIPESVFATFQLTFAIITVALIVGAIAERMRFGALLLFSAMWVTLVYFPIAHMVWSGDGAFLWDHGVLDFAGGTVVHINAGVAALVACIVLGKRKGYPTTAMPPHNLTYTVIGTALLWVGWFGFNAGSALGANASAGMAMLVTQIATAAAALGWTAAEWITHRKASMLGIATGAVAGLVAVTPAAGSCGPGGALLLGAISGVTCFYAATKLKQTLGYDDSLDVFGVHGVGGMVGAVLTGVFASAALGGAGYAEGVTMMGQVGKQILGVVITVIYCGVLTWVLLKLTALVVPLRVEPEAETEGLDLAQHNERGYNF
jgi:Amt family ammonium transporter